MPPRILTILTALTLFGIAIFLASCNRQKPTASMKTVTVAQLGKETEHLPFFYYVGSDADYDYFATMDNQRYRIARSKEGMAHTFSINNRMGLCVTVKDGEITVPGKSVSTLSEYKHRRSDKASTEERPSTKGTVQGKIEMVPATSPAIQEWQEQMIHQMRDQILNHIHEQNPPATTQEASGH